MSRLETRRRRAARFVAVWLAHLDWPLHAASVAVLAAAFAAEAGWLLWVAFGLVSTAMISDWFTPWHHRSMCHLCARAFPLDGMGKSLRRWRTLRYCHVSEGWGVSLAQLVMWVGGVAASFYSPTVALLLLGALWLWYCVDSYAWRVHLPLRRWCTKCEWDDNGPSEEVSRSSIRPGFRIRWAGRGRVQITWARTLGDITVQGEATGRPFAAFTAARRSWQLTPTAAGFDCLVPYCEVLPGGVEVHRWRESDDGLGSCHCGHNGRFQ